MLMSGYLAGLDGLEKFYLACAVFGGGFFIFRTILMLSGISGTDSDVDSADMDHGGVDHDTDHGDDSDHAEQAHGDSGLKLLTIQGITAFIMMFGLTAFSFSRNSLLGSVMTIILGIAVGIFGMWLIAKGFALMRSMQSTGTMQIYDAIGEEGTVYLTIPAEGVGKIQVVISGRLMVRDAVSQDKVDLKTGERVCVSEIISGEMLAVRRL
jgi:membrane protein implicated in regulation of membrane protease activity